MNRSYALPFCQLSRTVSPLTPPTYCARPEAGTPHALSGDPSPLVNRFQFFTNMH
jgi:hypothetical protein